MIKNNLIDITKKHICERWFTDQFLVCCLPPNQVTLMCLSRVTGYGPIAAPPIPGRSPCGHQVNLMVPQKIVVLSFQMVPLGTMSATAGSHSSVNFNQKVILLS